MTHRDQALEGGRGWRVTGHRPGEPASARAGAPATVELDIWQGRGGSVRFTIEVEPAHAEWLAADLVAMASAAREES
jgi:hypothetical protein